jgi:hypothetical protein
VLTAKEMSECPSRLGRVKHEFSRRATFVARVLASQNEWNHRSWPQQCYAARARFDATARNSSNRVLTP